MKNSLVSIIIPTYNRELIWEKCLTDSEGLTLITSLLNQSYNNIEIIIIDDGSTDNTSFYLKKLQNLDNRIIIVNKSNGGPSDARNKGIEVSRGEYVFFIDDDDKVPTNYIESFLTPENEGFNLIIDSYSNKIGSQPIKPVNFPKVTIRGRESIINYLFDYKNNAQYFFFPIGKRFDLKIIKDNNIRFDKRLSLGEDRPFLMDYLNYCDSCKLINNSKYIVNAIEHIDYRMSQGIKPIKILWETFKINYYNLLDYYRRHNLQIIKDYSDNFIVSKFIEYILIRYALNIYDDKIFIKEIVKWLTHLNINPSNIKSKKNKFTYLILKWFGLSIWVFMFKINNRINKKFC